MKGSITMIQSSDELHEKIKTIKILEKIMKKHKIKKVMYILNTYKMLNISAETCAKNGIETLFDCLKFFWLNEKHTENTIGCSVWRNITKNITFKI